MPRIRPNRWFMHVNEDETDVTLHGVNMGGRGFVLARNEDYIVVKWPAGKHWSGNYQPWAYHSPHTEVYRIIEDRDDMIQHPGPNTENSSCIEWSNRKR